DLGSSPLKKPKRKFLQRMLGPLFRFFGVSDDFPLLKQLSVSVFAFIFVFFSSTLFVPLYHYNGWVQANYEEDFDLIAISDPLADDPLNSLISEDGFIIKPALNSAEGDRSEANQIFLYTVEAGDTLSTIAQQFGIKKETLIMENELWNATTLRVGANLKILPVDGVSHTLKKGDTVSTLAQKYEVDPQDILRQHQLEEGATLALDTALIIPGGEKERPVVVAYVPPPTREGSFSRATGSTAPAVPDAGAAPSTGARLIWPTNSCGKLTQGFRSGHLALDIACRAKGPIYASAAGTVITSSDGWNGGYGHYIIIDHGNGMQTLYAHNEKRYVNVG